MTISAKTINIVEDFTENELLPGVFLSFPRDLRFSLNVELN